MLLPNTNGLSVFEAALMYADAGIPIAPFDPSKDKGKSCGNLLGRKDIQESLGLTPGLRWHELATTHKPTLERWHKTLGGFEAIATSPGRFGVVVADVDTPELFPKSLRAQAKKTAHVITRGKRRGHYFFTSPVPVGNSALPWGELRSAGGGIVLSPYPRDNRHVMKSGAMQSLPTELISVAGVVVERVDLQKFCRRHTESKYPKKLKALVSLHDYHLARCNPHLAMQNTLRTGLQESVIGFVSAKDVLDTLKARWDRGSREFLSLAVWCAGVAEQSDKAVVEAMSRRNKGSDSRVYAGKLK